MHIIISGQNFKLSDSLKKHTEEKIGKLKKYFEQINETDVVFHTDDSKEKEKKDLVEVTIWANGTTIHAEGAGQDLYCAIDVVVERLERQIKRYKEKLKTKNRRKMTETKDRAITHSIMEMEREEVEMESPQVIRARKYALKPLFIEEAAMQLKEFGREFLVFTNAETEQVNVVYKRKDGTCGLIEPER
ncbi:MAG: ribosome-associated translation inhibitor RaiA [Candidatus Muirbacterium halophilum]|nr:ribosome-associated translation inhibitor RaiA [Candidatus Muirbacterium halophilum]MCK9476640.1 ribosome-associated translation inhibitor RaiA [Candidatus Muirbacterium halophilum]